MVLPRNHTNKNQSTNFSPLPSPPSPSGFDGESDVVVVASLMSVMAAAVGVSTAESVDVGVSGNRLSGNGVRGRRLNRLNARPARLLSMLGRPASSRAPRSRSAAAAPRM